MKSDLVLEDIIMSLWLCHPMFGTLCCTKLTHFHYCLSCFDLLSPWVNISPEIRKENTVVLCICVGLVQDPATPPPPQSQITKSEDAQIVYNLHTSSCAL